MNFLKLILHRQFPLYGIFWKYFALKIIFSFKPKIFQFWPACYILFFHSVLLIGYLHFQFLRAETLLCSVPKTVDSVFVLRVIIINMIWIMIFWCRNTWVRVIVLVNAGCKVNSIMSLSDHWYEQDSAYDTIIVFVKNTFYVSHIMKGCITSSLYHSWWKQSWKQNQICQ